MFKATYYNRYIPTATYCERIFWMSVDECIYFGEWKLVSWFKEQKGIKS